MPDDNQNCRLLVALFVGKHVRLYVCVTFVVTSVLSQEFPVLALFGRRRPPLPRPSLLDIDNVGAMGKDEHMFSHMINIGRFWMFSLYYVVSELWGSVG